jgi:hypothetical protein
MGVFLAVGVWALSALVGTILMRIIGVPDEGSLVTPLAAAAVAVPTWAAHGRGRGSEIRAVRMHGAAAWFTRCYRYLANYGLLVLALSGAAGLLETLLSVLIGRQESWQPDRWPRSSSVVVPCSSTGERPGSPSETPPSSARTTG